MDKNKVKRHEKIIVTTKILETNPHKAPHFETAEPGYMPPALTRAATLRSISARSAMFTATGVRVRVTVRMWVRVR
jgi:hypothetical protein